MDNKSTIDAAKQIMLDATITNKIKLKYLTEDVLKGSKIHVSTQDGKVTLTGTLPTFKETNHAIDIASNIDGLKQVISKLFDEKKVLHSVDVEIDKLSDDE